MTRAAARASAILAVSLLQIVGCDSLEDRLTCHDLRIDLVNNRQALAPVHITIEDEAPSDVTWLEAGATRRIVECLKRGDRRTFWARRDGATLGSVTCPVSLNHEQLLTTVARVEWAPGGFRCHGW